MPPTPISIVRRRIDIDFDSAATEHWFPSLDIEALLNAISFFFPAGEKFFIESVQNYMGQITDPILKEQALSFIYQEAMHTKMHSRCNRLLSRKHPNSRQIERVSEGLLNLAKRFTPKPTQLAITCALEHFTALLADSLLQTLEAFIDQSQPAFGKLWAWHAVEETEHKAVCFDVYRQVVGTGPIAYLNRAFTMAVTSLIFIAAIGLGMTLLKLGNRHAYSVAKPHFKTQSSPRNASRFGRRNLFELLGPRIPLRLYFDYYRPSFHPWDHDNAHLIDQWKRRFPNIGG